MNNEFKIKRLKNETRYILENASAGTTSAAMVAAVETSLGVLQRRVDVRKKSSKRAYMENQDFNGEYDDEAGMAESNLHTLARAVQGLIDTIKKDDNLPEWCQEKIAKAELMLVSVWDYLLSQKEQGIDPKVDMEEGVAESINVQRGMVYNKKGRLMGTWDGSKFTMDPDAEEFLGADEAAHWQQVYQSELLKQTTPLQRTPMTHRYADDLVHRQSSRGVAEGLSEEEVDTTLAKIEREVHREAGRDDWELIQIKLLDAVLNKVGRDKRRGYEPHVMNVNDWDDAKEFLTVAFRDAQEQGVAEDPINELSPDLLTRAAGAAAKKRDELARDPRLKLDVSRSLSRHYDEKRQKFAQGAQAAAQRDALAGVSRAAQRRAGVAEESDSDLSSSTKRDLIANFKQAWQGGAVSVERAIEDAMRPLLNVGVLKRSEIDAAEEFLYYVADMEQQPEEPYHDRDEDPMLGIYEGLRDPKDNPCWKGYKPVGTKKKGGRTVPNCVPVKEDDYTIDLFGKLEQVVNEKAPPGDKYERMVKHIKKGYAKDGKLTDIEMRKAYGAAWKAKNKSKN